MTNQGNMIKTMLQVLVFALLLLNPALGAIAQAYPTKTIHLLVSFPAGGPADILSRVVAKKLSDGLGEQVVVENRPGAGGTIAMEAVSKSPPDGYTLVLGSKSTFAIAPILYRKLNYDPFKSFAPISLIARSSSVVLVSSSVPAASLRELIALAKSKPGKLNFGSNGNGTIPHLAGMLFQSLTGVSFVHIPYKGAAQVTTDLLAGQIQVAFIVSAGLEQYVRDGKLKALAVASSKRLPQLPEVPTAAEAGLPGFETYTWFGLVAPQGTPQDVIQRLNAETLRSLAAKEVNDVLVKQGFEPEGTSPEQFSHFITAEAERWAPVIRASGMRLD